MRTAPQRHATRAEAERALWKMAGNGQADSTQDQRFRALVLLATFASLRWGEVTALTRADLDLKARTVRVRVADVERSTGPLVLWPPKSRAGRRIVGIPAAIVPGLERHLAVYVKPDAGALVFPGIMGGPIRRGNFNKLSGWPHAVEALGTPGLHFHDLRHTGNQFAANTVSLGSADAHRGGDLPEDLVHAAALQRRAGVAQEERRPPRAWAQTVALGGVPAERVGHRQMGRSAPASRSSPQTASFDHR
jgi:integrase